MADLYKVMADYQERFHDSVNTVTLSEEALEKAPALLRKAIDEDKPFKTDAEWYRALGYTDEQMPDEDADL